MDNPLDPESRLYEHLTRHQGRVRRLVRSLLRDEHAAEDIVQDAWVTALQRPPRVESDFLNDHRSTQAPGAWFKRVAGNLALNARRGDQRRRDREQLVGTQRDAVDHGAAVSSAEIVARLELQSRLTSALESLEEPDRSLLRDHFLGEQTLAAIARRDGIPESTLRSRLSRGLVVLRNRLDAEPFLDDGGEVISWSLALAPLATVPRSWMTTSASVSSAGSTLAGATLWNGLTSLFGVLMIKKAAVLAAAALAMLLVTWKVVLADDPVPREPAIPELISSTDTLATLPDEEKLPAAVADVTELAGLRTEAALSGSEVAAEKSLETLTLQGTLEIEGTSRRPAPTDVSIRVYSGYSEDGEALGQHTVRSDGQGQFRLDIERPEETVTLTLRAKVVDCIALGPRSVTIPKGQAMYEIHLQYEMLDTIVHGVVFTPDGEPAPDARVNWGGLATECDDNGAYELHVTPRIYRFYASHPSYGQAAALAKELEKGSRTRIDLTLTPALNIRGAVRDEHGAAVEGARVATFFGGDLHAISDASGAYVIRGFPRANRDIVSVDARLDGYVTSADTIQVPEAGDVVKDFVLRRGSHVFGRVLSPEGGPVAGAEVMVGRNRFDAHKLDTRTDDDGEFDFPAVPAGDRLIWVTAQGFADMRHKVTVPGIGEGATNVPIELERGRTIRGRALDRDGAAIEGLRISIKQDKEYVGDGTVCGADGAFEISSMPVGELVAFTYAPGWVGTSAPVNEDGEVTITVQRAGSLRGRVVDGETGAPITAFRIRMITPLLPEGDKRYASWSAAWMREGYAFEDANGRWTSDNEDVSAGSAAGVEAWAAGYAPGIKNHVVVPPEGSGEEVLIELWRAVDVSVLVKGEDAGSTVAGAKVTLTQERHLYEMDRSWSGVTGEDGVALVPGAAPGPIWVQVFCAEAEQELTLGPFEIPPVLEGAQNTPPFRIEVAIPIEQDR